MSRLPKQDITKHLWKLYRYYSRFLEQTTEFNQLNTPGNPAQELLLRPQECNMRPAAFMQKRGTKVLYIAFNTYLKY